MLVQTIKLSGIAALLTLGLVGTVVLAQQRKNPNANSAEAPVASPKNKPSSAAEPSKNPSRREIDLKTRYIEQILDQPIDLDLKGDTALDQFLKRIRDRTRREPYPGIPIYVNPIGLQEAEVSIGSNIVSSPFLPGATLRQVLFGTLHPMKLAFIVKDGFLMIDSRSGITELRVVEMERKLDRVLEALERLERAR